MFSTRIQKYSLYFTIVFSINLIHQSSVIKCQTSPKRSQTLEISKNSKKKDIPNESIAEKEIESETQMAIEDLVNTSLDLTTLSIDNREAINETTNENVNEIEKNSTLDQRFRSINETIETTPMFSSNLTANDSLVSITETYDYINGTEYEILTNLTTHSTSNYSTTPTPDVTELAEEEETEPYSEVTDILKESLFSSTVSAIEASTVPNIELDMSFNEAMPECVFETHIRCKNFELNCFGAGEIDCGSRTITRRSVADNETYEEDYSGAQVFKSYLERDSQSDNILNNLCALTAFANMDFWCSPLPNITHCSGKSVCKPTDKSADLEVLPFWKVGLIAALTAIGAICFIIVGVIAYVSYNKLKVRPESSANGCHNNPQNVTRV